MTKTEKGDDGKMHEQLIPIGSPICKMPKSMGEKCAVGSGGPVAPKSLKVGKSLEGIYFEISIPYQFRDLYSFQWYFDTNTFECLAFTYTGCGGNDNRFDSPAECWEKCKLGERLTKLTEWGTNDQRLTITNNISRLSIMLFNPVIRYLRTVE